MNTRLNVVAVDAETDECLAALLPPRGSLTSLSTPEVLPVVVRAIGLFFGIDPQLSAEEIHSSIDCTAYPVCNAEPMAGWCWSLWGPPHLPMLLSISCCCPYERATRGQSSGLHFRVLERQVAPWGACSSPRVLTPSVGKSSGTSWAS